LPSLALSICSLEIQTSTQHSITNTIFSTDELEQDLRVRIKLVGDKLTKVQCPKRVIGRSGPVASSSARRFFL
jgi:hypothetical protein